MSRVARLALGFAMVVIGEPQALADPPDTAGLVRQVWQREAWIERVESLQLKAEEHHEWTAKGLEFKRRELHAQFPEADLSKFPELKPQWTTNVELAFDRTRICRRDQWVGFDDDLRIWDGRRFTLRNRYELWPERNGYLINREPGKWLYWLVWNDFFSFRAGPHLFWWHGLKERAEILRRFGKPEDYAYEGQAEFHGTACHVVSHWDSWTTLYIALADGHLRGLKRGALTSPKLKRALTEALRHKGYRLDDETDLERVSASISRRGGTRYTVTLRPGSQTVSIRCSRSGCQASGKLRRTAGCR